jgi:hypothetical protein
MNKIVLLASVVTASVAAAVFWFYQSKIAISEIEFLGENFKLPRSYSSYDSYRNDPENLGTKNLKRVQELVQTSPVSGTFESVESFGKYAFALKFPGFGMSNIPVEACDPGCMLLAIEVPGTKKWRHLLAIQRPSGIVVADDFIHEGPRFTQVIMEKGMVKYKSMHTTIRERQL